MSNHHALRGNQLAGDAALHRRSRYFRPPIMLGVRLCAARFCVVHSSILCNYWPEEHGEGLRCQSNESCWLQGHHGGVLRRFPLRRRRAIPRDAAGTIVTLPCMATPSCSHPKAIFGPWESAAARRGALTSDSGVESMARISADGRSVAFVGQYEGPAMFNTLPLAGAFRNGAPEGGLGSGRLGARWPPDVSTNRFSTLPDPKLVLLDAHGGRDIVPLAQGSEAAYGSDGRTLFFTRWRNNPASPSVTRRLQRNSLALRRRQRGNALDGGLDGHLPQSDVLE